MAQYQSYITSSALGSIHPNQNVFPFTLSSFPQTVKDKVSGSVAVGVGFKTSSNFTGEVLDRIISSPFTSPTTPTTDKIRIIPEQTQGNVLSPYFRIEKTNALDYNSDTNQLNIVFSQTNQINKDIVGQFGKNFSLDEYAGDPQLQYSSSYDTLDELKSHYESKYTGPNNSKAFINIVEDFDTSVLQTVEKLIPGRTNPTIGASVESHILDRSKHKRLEPTVTNNTYIDGGSIVGINFSDFTVTGTGDSGSFLDVEGTSPGTLYTSPSADQAFDSKNSTLNQVDITDQNQDVFTPSDFGYVDSEGNPVNYQPGLTVSEYSLYEQSIYNTSTDANITDPTPDSTLVYIFDSLVPYNIPAINLSPFSSQLKNYYLLSNDDVIVGGDLGDYLGPGSIDGADPIVAERTANAIKFKNAYAEDDVYYDLQYVLTSSYFDIPDGAQLSISGSFSQPNMGAFGLGSGFSGLGEAVTIDSGDSLTGWVTNSSAALTFVIASGSFPYPSGSSTTNEYLDYSITNGYSTYEVEKTFSGSPTDGSKIRVSFWIVSTGNIGGFFVKIKQGGSTKATKSWSASSIFYNSSQEYIEFNSTSGSFQFEFYNSYSAGSTQRYKLDTFTTQSYGTEYNSPYIKIRIVSGSYQDFKTNGITGQVYPTGSDRDTNITEILSTGQIQFDDPAPSSQMFDTSTVISGSSYSNAFLEIEFYVSKSIYSGNLTDLNTYNANPIAINNLLVDTGDIEEKYAFRVEKVINVDTDSIVSSEVITKDDDYFTSYINNEVDPNFTFSIVNFEDTPNRLKPIYHVYTASFGDNKDLIERGNLVGRNYIPIDLSFGSNEEDDFPEFYNFSNKGIILPSKVSNDFIQSKQTIINFVKDEVESSR